MNYEQIARLRVVYHQAGHVVAAYLLGVEIDRVSVATGEGFRPGIRWGALYRALLIAPSGAAQQAVLRRHLIARLAGQVAEMEFTMLRFRATGHEVHKTRWRSRWVRNLFSRNEVDTDFVYATLCAWGVFEQLGEVRWIWETIWRDAEALLRKRATWRQIELLAAVLQKRPVLTGKEAFAVIRPLAP